MDLPWALTADLLLDLLGGVQPVLQQGDSRSGGPPTMEGTATEGPPVLTFWLSESQKVRPK